ncbi:MAG: hypothetical protein BroJett013_30250 [Alphaproteobacteria bacterium]|nr:MAG: hypothetical protein BroJett013_30250 [Alphaproteobacteria bacterium]
MNPDADLIELIRVRTLTPLRLVKQELAERERSGGATFIWAARDTKFWSHDPNAGRTIARGVLGQDLSFVRVGPRGEDLFEIADWRAFLAAAEANPAAFGEFGLAALEAAHGDNCLHPFETRCWSAATWTSYAHALKRNARRAA